MSDLPLILAVDEDAEALHRITSELQRYARDYRVVCGPSTQAALEQLEALRANDASVAIGVSFRGETRETLDFLTVARRTGALTIGITNAAESSLDDVCDVVLRTSVRESRFRSGAMASRIAQLALIDMLFVLVLRDDFPVMTESLRRTYDAVQSRRPDHDAAVAG